MPVLQGRTVQGQGRKGLEEVLLVGQVLGAEVDGLVAQQELHPGCVPCDDGVRHLDGRLVVHEVSDELGVVRGLLGELDERLAAPRQVDPAPRLDQLVDPERVVLLHCLPVAGRQLSARVERG